MAKLTAKAMVALQQNAIASINNNDSIIQEYLSSEVLHIEQHRNPTRLNEFFAAIKGSGARTVAMNAFIQYFGNVTFDDESKSYGVKPKRTANLNELKEAMNDKPWIEHKPEQKITQFNIQTRVQSLLKAAIKAASEDRLVGSDLDTIAKLDSFAVKNGLIETSVLLKETS